MHLRNYLLETLYNKTCFLCFKTGSSMMNVYSDDLQISDKYFDRSINLVTIMKFLFPSDDIILSKSCSNCADLLIEMYMVVYKKKYLQNILNDAIEKITNKIHKLTFDNCKTYTINLSSTLKDNIKSSIKTVDPEIKISNNDVSEITEDNEKLKDDNSILQEKPVSQCPQCSKVLKNNKSMLTHIKRHHYTRKKKYYKCTTCSYKTLCKNTLEGHKNKQHLNIRPFVCNTCFKGFFTKSNLVEHIQSHNNMKELCDICGEVFRQKKTLIMHLRLHSDTRPYECNICGKRYITSGRRSDHVKRSHMVKTECCLICNKQFGLRKELVRHVKNVHS